MATKIDLEKSKKDLKDLSYDVIQLQKNNFNLGIEKLKTEKQKPQNKQDQLRELVTNVYNHLKQHCVLTSQQMKEFVCMDDLTSLAQFLAKLTIFVNDRYYLKQLDTSELTSARNMLLELMLQNDAPT